LKNLSNQDFIGLKIYFDSTPELHQDSVTDHLIYRLHNKCDVEMENYPDVITWFENDILNPASVDDSIFSLIDLGDTYLLMQADSNMKSSFLTYTGSLTQYKPKNREEYIRNRNEWIKLLFEDQVYIKDDLLDNNRNETSLVKQNIPNPFSATTDVSFTISEASKVIVYVTNILAQNVETFKLSYHTKGQYSITIDLSDEPDGFYFIILYANQKEIGKIKALKNN